MRGHPMTRDHAVFLRGISNVPMEPFRAALVGLGLKQVDSFGATGNLVFGAPGSDVALLEQRICEAIGAEAFVRTGPRPQSGATTGRDRPDSAPRSAGESS